MRLPRKESLTVEFKSERTKPTPDRVIIDNVVAMSNTEGGTLYLGVEDDGTPTGVHREHESALPLISFIFNSTVPPVSARVNSMNIDGKRVIAITVPEADQIVSSKSGRVTRRSYKGDGAPETVPMYPYEFASRLASIGQYDYTAQIAEGTTSDVFDGTARDLLRKNISTKNDKDPALSMGDSEFDASMGLTTLDPSDGATRSTMAGILMEGSKQSLQEHVPTARIVFQVLQGLKLSVDQRMILPVPKAVDTVMELLRPWNIETEIMYGVQSVRYPKFAPMAVREAFINALCHRDYSVNQEIIIQINESGLTISSPGGFIKGVDADNILTVTSSPRNDRLANALRSCGYMERSGRGVDGMFSSTIAIGRAWPDYSESNNDFVMVRFPDRPLDEKLVKLLHDTSTEFRPTVEEFMIMAVLSRRGRMNIRQLELECHPKVRNIPHHVQVLMDANCVLSMGNYYYLAIPQIDEQRKKAVETEGDLVLNFLSLHNEASVSAIAQDLSKTIPSTRRLLKKLVDAGKIRRQGNTRDTTYRLP